MVKDSPVASTPLKPVALPTPTGLRFTPSNTTRPPAGSTRCGEMAWMAQSFTSSTASRTRIQSEASPLVTVTLRE